MFHRDHCQDTLQSDDVRPYVAHDSRRIADSVLDSAAADAAAGPDENNTGCIAPGNFAVDNEKCRNR